MDVSRAARRIAEECACLQVRKASRSLSRLYDEELRATGLQTSQLAVLVAIARFGEEGAAIGRLAQALVLERTTLTRNLRPLENAGLVRVARSPEDARARVVLLTRAGERAIEAAYPAWERAQHRLVEALGARSSTKLKEQLAEVVKRIPSEG